MFPNSPVCSLLLGLILSLPLRMSAEEQPWRSALYPENWKPPGAKQEFGRDAFVQDFSQAGYRYGTVAIPSPTSGVIDVTAAPYQADASGTHDSTAAIQSAIDAAAARGGGVVYLPAGTYQLSPANDARQCLLISHSAVILRGAGVGKTFLLNTSFDMRERSIIRVQGSAEPNWRAGWQGAANFTQDELGPTRSLRVDKPERFSVGDWICVRNNITDDWIAEQGVTDWEGHGQKLGGIAYLRKITAIDAATGTITVDLPTRYALKLRDKARIGRVAAPLDGVGLEGFSIANRQNPANTGWGEDDYQKPGTAGYTSHRATVISMTGVVDGWIRQVATFQPEQNTSTAHLLSNGIELLHSRSITVQDCDFQRPQYGGGGGNGYMYRINNSSDNLVQRSRAEFSRHGYVFSGLASSGNVIHESIDKDTGRATGFGEAIRTSGYGSDHHMWYSHSNLIDNCTADSSMFVAVYRPFGGKPCHGLTAVQSVFWNTRGIGQKDWQVGLKAFNLGSYAVASEQWGQGYVIGTQGNRPDVRLQPLYGKDAHPLDHVEGVGKGASLQPASLYTDQLARRTKAARP